MEHGNSIDVYGFKEQAVRHDFVEGLLVRAESVNSFKFADWSTAPSYYNLINVPLGSYETQGWLSNNGWTPTKRGIFVQWAKFTKLNGITTFTIGLWVKNPTARHIGGYSYVYENNFYKIEFTLKPRPRTKAYVQYDISSVKETQDLDISNALVVTYQQNGPPLEQVVGPYYRRLGVSFAPFSSGDATNDFIGTIYEEFGLSHLVQDVSAVKGWSEKVMNYLSGILPTQGNIDEACLSAASDMATVNFVSLENCKDLIDSPETIVASVELLKSGVQSIRNPLTLLKFLSAFHLWWRYVVKTTAMDAGELWELLKEIWKHRHELADFMRKPLIGRGRAKSRPFHSYLGFVNSTFTSKISVGYEKNFDFIFERLQGTAIKPSHFWGLIPLSFVVDWVLPIENEIDSIFLVQDLKRARILADVFSTKNEVYYDRNFKIGRYVYRFIGKATTYDRSVSKSIRLSNFPLPFKFRIPAIKNWVTGLALFIAMKGGR